MKLLDTHESRIGLVSALLQFVRDKKFAFDWDDVTFLRVMLVRREHRDGAAWSDFANHLRNDLELAWALGIYLDEQGFDFLAARANEDDECIRLLDESRTHWPRRPAESTSPSRKSKSNIKYIEAKPGITGSGRIGRVSFSKSGKTLHYGGRRLQSLKGAGYKANFYDIETREEFWISNCRQDGNDTLYPVVIEIDDDAREEYWIEIRGLPARVSTRSFRSEGKYRK